MKYFFPIIFTIVIFLKIIGGYVIFFNDILTQVYIALLCISVAYCLMTRKGIKVLGLYAVYVLFLFLNILITQPDEKFHSLERLVFFVLMLALLSPMFQNENFRFFRNESYKISLYATLLISTISFFAYFFDINLMQTKDGLDVYSDYREWGGHFSGITTHSMIMGPISAISSIFCLNKFFSSKKKLFAVFFVFSIGSLLFSAARSAILGCILALIVVIIKQSPSSKILLKRVIIIAVITVLTVPLWVSALSGVMYKQYERSDAGGGVLVSRSGKFENRIDEFLQSPIYGIGFSSTKYNIDIHEEGNIEPGSSWLYILSTTGIIGFVLICYLFRLYSFRSKKRRRSFYALNNQLDIGIFVFFVIHMLFEGYIFAAGNLTCILLWLNIGHSADLYYLKNNE